jgi:hypothetical protein
MPGFLNMLMVALVVFHFFNLFSSRSIFTEVEGAAASEDNTLVFVLDIACTSNKAATANAAEADLYINGDGMVTPFYQLIFFHK